MSRFHSEVVGRSLCHFGPKSMLQEIRLDVRDTKMNKMLSSRFAEAKTPKIDWEGEPLYGIYEIDPAPECMMVEFLNAITSPVQGLSLKVYGGTLLINDVEAQELILWRDTAPRRIAVQLKTGSDYKTKLKIWNVWRGVMGNRVEVTQAWLGNAGMRIDQSTDKKELLLQCSDGEGPIDFNNLEIRLVMNYLDTPATASSLLTKQSPF